MISGNINFNLWNAERAAHDTQKEFVFFEIVKPPELEFTYKIVPAIGFGAPFVSWIQNFTADKIVYNNLKEVNEKS